ncbi:hypothetical protein GCM10010156_36410 [Planobispora rosea]|uniref:Peptidase M48 domain-containing protein n=2 Tax=Planobispora rosea TaxID=35762 RepID=A0A8J3RW14_PLARO|nr:hypothetical protein GCM10010156_36410 [Planobispora rosea]GIH81715.1 hypothetical protein Pro02_01230 [Planobispora rosea]
MDGMSTPTPASLAALADTLRTAAALPGLLVYLSPELDDNACAETRRCTPAPLVGIGTALLATAGSDALHGTIAHEIAHHALGHSTDPAVPLLDRLSTCSAIGAALAWAAHLPGALTLALAVVAITAYLTSAWMQRRAEYAADAYAAVLLDRIGQPGAAIVAATLSAHLADEPRWYARIGWLTGSHPTTAARLHRLTHPRTPNTARRTHA